MPRRAIRPSLPRALLLLAMAALAAGAAEPPYELAPLTAPAPVAGSAPLYTSLDPAAIGLTVANQYGDRRMWGERFREFTLGALETGIAVADFFHDGRPAIFAVSKTGPCALYRQVEPYRFVDVATAAGVACTADPAPRVGATVVDINQDGWPDLYVCRYDAPNLLFINNHDGTFTECAHAWGLDLRDASVMASFADYDGDGFLDCYLVTNILNFAQSPLGQHNHLLRNNGNGTFTDVSKAAGIWGLSQGHAALWFDPAGSGWPDLYVANDFETPDRFYHNRRDGTFSDLIDERLPHVTYFSMGADFGDLNNDGRTDFIVTDMRDRSHSRFLAGLEEAGRGLWESERTTELIPQYMWNTVYLGTGTKHYEEAAHLFGMDATGWTWSVRIGDLDNDGHSDVLFTAGMLRNFVDPDLIDRQNVAPNLLARATVWKDAPPRKDPMLAFHNLGDLRFAECARQWGLERSGISFACALVDLANTGRLDVVISNQDGPPTIFRNTGPAGHSMEVKLDGWEPNRDGIGATLRIETESGWQMRQLYTEHGSVTSEPALAHFGLGSSTHVRQLVIRWPSGTEQVIADLPADRRVIVHEPPSGGSGRRPADAAAPPASPLYQVSTGALRPAYQSLPADVDEFVKQPLLPRRLNAPGPALAVADVNGDGRPDLFVAGTSGNPGVLYLAKEDGTFSPAPNQPWNRVDGADTPGAVFFTEPATGRPGLFLTRGGVRLSPGDPALGGELYWGDGLGNFVPAPAATAALQGFALGPCAAVVVTQPEGVLIFAGGRAVPGRWPETPRSFLLRLEGGKLNDVTAELAPDMARIGMVTAVAWADLDGTGQPDLVLTLEWGAVRIFHHTSHGYTDETERRGLANVRGWWSALCIADVNGDGRPDLIVGNVGLNTKYHATSTEPTMLFAGDLDGSGRSALLEAQYEDGRLCPVRGRSKLAYTFPWVRSRFPTFSTFAQASLSEIFSPDKLAAATALSANELASGVFMQQPDHTFRFTPLPRAAQLAPVNAIICRDLNGDGHPDLLLVGNNFGPEPSTGRFDGGIGLLLHGDGRGGFTPAPADESGIVVTGEARASVAVPIAGRKQGVRLVIARNRGELLVFDPAQ